MEKRGEEIMPRPYSDKFILGLNKGDPKSKGVQLGKICVKAGLPAKYVANVFGVSRMSIHGWFRGNIIRNKNITKIDKFIELVNNSLADGDLPVATIEQAKIYLATIKPNLIRV